MTEIDPPSNFEVIALWRITIQSVTHWNNITQPTQFAPKQPVAII